MTTLNVASLCVPLAQLLLFPGLMLQLFYLVHGVDGLGIHLKVYQVMMRDNFHLPPRLVSSALKYSCVWVIHGLTTSINVSYH